VNCKQVYATAKRILFDSVAVIEIRLMVNDTQLDTLRGSILAVDDSPTIRKLVSMTMEGQGYRVIVAADGIEALAILKDEHPDLILCDVAMPKLDGYQLCKIIKSSSDTKHIPVVMLSGRDGLFDRVRGKMAGCSNYITKPFEPDLLIAEVRKYVKPALIPMSPYKPKKKTPEATSVRSAADVSLGAASGDAAGSETQSLRGPLPEAMLPPSSYAVAAPDAGGLIARSTPAAPAPASVRAEKPPATDAALPPDLPRRGESKTAVPSIIAGEGTIELDKLLAELDPERDNSAGHARPCEPFRSRCPGCRTVFKNVRPGDYDKQARCKKCGTRFHLGENLVA